MGAAYEQMAADYLAEHGYRILDRNVHVSRYGELDIVAEKDGGIAVVEVKFRTATAFGDPLEAVDQRKQRRISRCALYYLMKHGYGTDTPLSFDVVAIYGDGTLRHIQNAFAFQG
ncbi:MAG: YraN family protein [Lachnospiraceae bacterium]|nr:YraN family protein [Lachnospiraceae bacterium]